MEQRQSAHSVPHLTRDEKNTTSEEIAPIYSSASREQQHYLQPPGCGKWNRRNKTIPIMVSQMQNGECTSSAHNASRYAAADRFGSHYSHQRMITKPLWHALVVFVSFLSFAICFPSDHVTISKSQRKEKVESRPSFQHAFLPDVFVLSLSSTSRSSKPELGRDTTHKKQKTTRKSNKIIVQSFDVNSAGQEQLPLQTIEYRRRKHEWAQRYTSQEGLREAFGSNRNKWWGDLDAKTARRVYKKLLFPTALSELVLELGDEMISLSELAPLAYEARKAAKLYCRERCRVPSRVGAYLFDGFRQLRKYGRFQPNGASYEQLWDRYYEEHGSHIKTHDEWEYLFGPDSDDDQIGDSDGDDDDDDDRDILDGVDDAVTEEEIVKRTCQKIFEKSRTTNEVIDRFYLEEYKVNVTTKDGDDDIHSQDIVENENEDNIESGVNDRGKKRWRNRKKRSNRYNDLLLERITQTLERDVRKLLEPPPSVLSSSSCEEERAIDGNCDESHHQCDQEVLDVNSGAKEENLSSRRMTPQEYHTLKLFAKARKRSQQQQVKDNRYGDTSNGPPTRKSILSNKSTSFSDLSSVTIADRKSVRDE